MNRIILLGRIGKEPERTQKGDTVITKFSLATSEKRKEDTETIWHNIICFANTAELSAKYLHKGDQVCIEGKQVNRSYDKQDGTKAYVSEVIASLIHFTAGVKQHSDSAHPQASQTEPIEDTGDIPF